MSDRFTDLTCRVLRLADSEANRLAHDHVGTEHLLLGVLREGTSQAARVLATLGVELRYVRLMVEKAIPANPAADEWEKPPRTPRFHKVLRTAGEEASLQGGNYRVGPEHLLLAILRDEDGLAAEVLRGLGVAPARVRGLLRGDPDLAGVQPAAPRDITADRAGEDARPDAAGARAGRPIGPAGVTPGPLSAPLPSPAARPTRRPGPPPG